MNTYEFEGLYLASAYAIITVSIRDIFKILIEHDAASSKFLEDNETDIIANTYKMIKENSNYLANDAIKALVSQNTPFVLAHSLLGNDNLDRHITSDEFYKVVNHFSNIIHEFYYF